MQTVALWVKWAVTNDQYGGMNPACVDAFLPSTWVVQHVHDRIFHASFVAINSDTSPLSVESGPEARK